MSTVGKSNLPPEGWKRWVPAPTCSGPMLPGDIFGVYLQEDEDVIWTYYQDRVVSYRIYKKQENGEGNYGR